MTKWELFKYAYKRSVNGTMEKLRGKRGFYVRYIAFFNYLFEALSSAFVTISAIILYTLFLPFIIPMAIYIRVIALLNLQKEIEHVKKTK